MFQSFYLGTRVDKRRIPDRSTGPCPINNATGPAHRHIRYINRQFVKPKACCLKDKKIFLTVFFPKNVLLFLFLKGTFFNLWLI